MASFILNSDTTLPSTPGQTAGATCTLAKRTCMASCPSPGSHQDPPLCRLGVCVVERASQRSPVAPLGPGAPPSLLGSLLGG